jgi:hypothetical protein
MAIPGFFPGVFLLPFTFIRPESYAVFSSFFLHSGAPEKRALFPRILFFCSLFHTGEKKIETYMD